MKIVGLILGILLLSGGGLGAVFSLLLPSLTNNRTNFGEAMVFFIPSVLIFVVGFLITVVAGIFVIRSKKSRR